MRSQLRFLSLSSFLAGCLLTLPAHARSSGITGYSGRQGVTCTQCHTANSNPKPTVQLSGPTYLTPGETGQYTFTITGGPGASSDGFGGMNVAVDNSGALLQPGTGLYEDFGELTHVGGNAFSGTSITFTFTLVAPETPGTVKMYAAGNSTDNNGNLTNDQSAATTLDILVSNDPPDAGTGNPPDAGTGNTPDAGPGPDTGTGKGGDGSSGCAAMGGPPMVWLVVMLAARARRRAQSR
jgi:hypothetical protein